MASNLCRKFKTQSDYQSWENAVSSNGIYKTYATFFGDPLAGDAEVLVPQGLQQPELTFPFPSGQTWFFTGGPHGGWGIGSAVINGALETIYANPDKYSEDQLIMRPFPQVASKAQKLPELWEQYRQRMVSLSGISIFLFGNKVSSNGELVLANGVEREFEIAVEKGHIVIPVGATGFVAKNLADIVLNSPEKYYQGIEWIVPLIKELADVSISHTELVNKIIKIIQQLGK